MPSWLVVTLFFVPMAVLVTTRLAPGITAPDGSVTRPEMVPRVSCDQPAAQASMVIIPIDDKMLRSMSTPSVFVCTETRRLPGEWLNTVGGTHDGATCQSLNWFLE